jgi:hypothetical protein
VKKWLKEKAIQKQKEVKEKMKGFLQQKMRRSDGFSQ